MHPPTSAQFFAVFRAYNDAVWPAQLALLGIGAATILAAFRANAYRWWRPAQTALLLLATLWLWGGTVYHKLFFAPLTPAGSVFGSLFIAEAALLALCAWQNGSTLENASRPSIVIGSSLILYAIAIYPALGSLLGHHYPAAPSFGTPCPTTIFTFGIFCLLPTRVPRFALAIPVLWALIGSYAALGFGVREDLGLLVAAVGTIMVIHRETNRPIAHRLAV
jgi:hypothetical protein